MTIRIDSCTDSRFLLENDRIAVEVDAAAGGKIRPLRSKGAGVNYLYMDPRGRLEHLTDYCSYDMSGFVECFPTVNTYRNAGACLLGIRGVVNDHSRGATVEECMLNIAFVGAQIQK